ncbi:MAG: tRNA (guanosine(37)-N1)-methyltransferase TrmD [Bacteroidales bacterium]|nr:tRNA (guanosine(37)-N1)-methyltransferase TrmD [Bacteroidales bacterium]
MKIDIITLFPEMLESFFSYSILKRAQNKGLLSVNMINLRDYSQNKYGSVDDYAFGGGAGMVLQVEPLTNCIEDLQSRTEYDEIIYTAPDGELLNQKIANNLSLKENLLILCGHYKGIDERVREHFVTQEISIGNYVLSGGELAAAVISDCLARLIPGVLNDEQSALSDSFQDGLVAPAVYSRPADFRGWKVPEVLLCGDPKKIESWQYENSIERTRQRRPELLSENELMH